MKLLHGEIQGLLETMKAELQILRQEQIYMEALLTAAESAVEEKKRVVSMYKAMAKLADDLLDLVMEDSNGRELDEETMKELVEEAIRDFNQAQSPGNGDGNGNSPTDGGNGGGVY
ncbi:hypothetical protein V6N13_014938 [Hibiscus sabdariffa]|uniref:Uncharacterized protein n=1 Tax=Hibiscus sabdariffa TaxID=183260 RepID=A0ABR2RXP1_9ROSI